MTTALRSLAPPRGGPEPPLPPLEAGDHLDQPTFHARYEATPEKVKAELVAGIVYMPSPAKRAHGSRFVLATRWLGEYESATPGVEGFADTTVILGPESEPRPDLCLLIAPSRGGQTRIADDYIVGAPELTVEIASSTEAYDLHTKKRDYERAGVHEYLAVVLREPRVLWFARRVGAFVSLAPGEGGLLRSEVFPGLWLDPSAILAGDATRLLDVLRRGLASPEHAAFAAKLAGAR